MPYSEEKIKIVKEINYVFSHHIDINLGKEDIKCPILTASEVGAEMFFTPI